MQDRKIKLPSPRAAGDEAHPYGVKRKNTYTHAFYKKALAQRPNNVSQAKNKKKDAWAKKKAMNGPCPSSLPDRNRAQLSNRKKKKKKDV